MKSNLITLALLSAAISGGAQTAPTTVDWTTPGNVGSGADAHYVQRFVLRNIGDGVAGMAFNQFARRMSTLNPEDTIRELVPGYYYVASPRFANAGDSLVIEIMTRAHLVNSSYAPDGVHLVKTDGTTAPVVYTRRPITRPEQWKRQGRDPMPYGDLIYSQNQARSTDWTPSPYDIIPSFKKITLLEKGQTPDLTNPSDRPGLIKILVRDGRPMFHGTNGPNLIAARNVYNAKIGSVNNRADLPDAVLEFEPDMEWRGLMIDVARNYQQPETIKDVLRLMADNGLNKLHFHLVDDEAWRLEIAPLPELTAVGSRRGWGTDETDHLYQIFTGDGNPDNYTNSSNGHLTRDQFKDIILTAYELGIDVIPEIESPGHARAAIRAMEARAKNGDSSYRLIHDGDTSVYTGAQSFHDNVMNPALPGPYKFMETVIDDIIAMYNEAGVPLKGIHIGGDEVPKGAWNGSEVARTFMEENNLADQHAFHAYFVTRIAKMLADRGIPMHGWQEVALGHSPEYDGQIAPVTGGINCWSTIIKKGEKPVPLRAGEGGYPVIISNVAHLYFD
ncbi:MAG: family 20 glycosylhydrolase, partial [Muribaculaceae bacterium]|nr:family 20 glycosylhydrolase [Muribaculaceae bacterium]